MTLLEQIIKQQVTGSVVATVSRATDKIAEEMAHEILRDPAFRQRMKILIEQAFGHTVRDLETPRRTNGRKRHKAK